ncbi:prokineticin-1-like [Ostrea edulis]|uniref:prokineticin-1-like n=1 Tax=Ostrea edulis TaxID=37623 RepID=UPI0024AF63FF|nr:prokineticin-1-like [Ostrea edulis]
MNVRACALLLLLAILELKQCSGICCNNDGDCPAYHCCESQRRGRRSVGCSVSSGICTPFGAQQQRCHVGHRFTCPCLPGLTCVGTGVTEIPQGEIGVCQRSRYG